MKKMVILCGIMLGILSLYSKPKADAYFRVTNDLPKHGGGTWNGIFSVTNTGETAFVVVTDKEWSGETVRFYAEGTEEQQRVEEALGRAQPRRDAERKEAIDAFYICVEQKKTMKTLQPGDGISFECECIFKFQHGTPIGLYKAEMYLGHDTWVPVHITPTLGILRPTQYDKGIPAGDFYYSQMGTNQYLYVKTEDGKFKQASEMKLGSRPEKEKGDDTVTFVSPDGETKKLTRDQARQIAREREQQNQ
ncbi:MAG: hypothetical protein FWF12_11510 [Betaproteobacteria bacterium]|nr:hypothetical protein [Betaproteobacteria bacterium]